MISFYKVYTYASSWFPPHPLPLTRPAGKGNRPVTWVTPGAAHQAHRGARGLALKGNGARSFVLKPPYKLHILLNDIGQLPILVYVLPK